MLTKLKVDLILHQEYESISVDATMRVTLSILGQPHPRAPQDAAAYDSKTRLTRVHTVRGRTSAVLAMTPMSGENTTTYARVLSEAIPAGAHGQVRFIATDDPSPALWREVSKVLPNLEIMTLDPVHLAIVYEYSTWNKRTEGSRLLRSLMAKFTAYDATINASTWGGAYTAADTRPLNREEELARARIEARSMSVHKARRIADAIDVGQPFITRVEFIEGLAALVALFPQEVQKVAKGANRPVFKILHTAAAWERIEWYLNNTRLRYRISSGKLTLLPCGTTSNESLHAEINGWFKLKEKGSLLKPMGE